MDRNIERLANGVVKEWNKAMMGNCRLLGQISQRAFVSQMIIDLMSVQDNQELPISTFLAVHELALEKTCLNY